MSYQEEFIKKIAPIIQDVAFSYGYNFPSAIIAQACLESGYGKSSLAYRYHNYFGMKCGSSWKGNYVNLQTMEEYTIGNLTKIRDYFRCYDSMEKGVVGYFDFIGYSRYANLKQATSPRDYLEKIKADGYATSSKYVDNVMRVINTYNLTQYDKKPTVQNVTARKSVEQLALEVIYGKWGNGTTRRQKLEAAGYDYQEVQNLVNQMLQA